MKMPRFDKGNVLVIGDVMLDRYWHGPASRLSPEAPVPVVKVAQIEDRPGGAANVALNLAALGSGALISGATGDDAAADSLQARLTAAGVHCGFSRSDEFPTITKLRVISQHQQLIRLDFEEDIPASAASAVNSSAIGLFGSAQAIVLSDYAKGTLAAPEELIAAAKARGISVLVDPKGSDSGNQLQLVVAVLLTSVASDGCQHGHVLVVAEDVGLARGDEVAAEAVLLLLLLLLAGLLAPLALLVYRVLALLLGPLAILGACRLLGKGPWVLAVVVHDGMLNPLSAYDLHMEVFW